jgi:hypothetical protein
MRFGNTAFKQYHQKACEVKKSKIQFKNNIKRILKNIKKKFNFIFKFKIKNKKKKKKKKDLFIFFSILNLRFFYLNKFFFFHN